MHISNGKKYHFTCKSISQYYDDDKVHGACNGAIDESQSLNHAICYRYVGTPLYTNIVNALTYLQQDILRRYYEGISELYIFLARTLLQSCQKTINKFSEKIYMYMYIYASFFVFLTFHFFFLFPFIFYI